MQTTEKKNYEAPQLTAVTFKAERGYAQSNLRLTALSAIVGGFTYESNAVGRESYTAEDDVFSF